MSLKLYVPGDSAAVAVGADEVAGALEIEAAKKSLAITIVRNGSRGAIVATLGVAALVGLLIGRRR